MSCSLRIRHFVLILLCSVSWTTLRADWPTFRGRDRMGVSNETGLLTEWPSGGPTLLWETRGVGRGYSSMSIVAGRIYTMGDNLPGGPDRDMYLICLDEEGGKEIWKTKVAPAWSEGQPQWHGPRSTPSVDGNLVIVVTPQGIVVCCESSSGREKWRVDFKKGFGGTKGDNWGYGESVLIDGDRVICTPGGSQTTMVALDKQTGATVWKMTRPGDRGAGHASANIAEVGETRIYVQTTAGGPIGVRASDGKFLWEYPIDRTTAVIPSPIIRGDLVFFSAGYGRGGALLRQSAGSDGAIGIEEVYGLKTTLGNRHGGIALIGDHIYGDQDNKGIPFCAVLATGEIKWQKRGSGTGQASLAATADRLYLLYADGRMVLAKADPNEYVEISSFKVPGSGERPSWAHPVILGGKLYIREHDRILCYDIRAR
jgi:outer membrane protein assembly factor BamB